MGEKIDTNTSFNRWIAVHWPLTIRRKAIAVFLCCPTKRARKAKMFSFVYALSRFLRGSWHIHHLYRLAQKKLFFSNLPTVRDASKPRLSSLVLFDFTPILPFLRIVSFLLELDFPSEYLRSNIFFVTFDTCTWIFDLSLKSFILYWIHNIMENLD